VLKRRKGRHYDPIGFLFLWLAGVLSAQQAPAPAAITIAQAVEGAVRIYPSIRVTQEQMNAAAAGIRLARTAYLPRVDALAQVNRATRNTFYGLLLPQSVIPGVDGVPANNAGSVWDSSMGVLVTWEPFDFGLRAANVSAAASARARAQAAVTQTQYDVSVATADAFLTVFAAQQTSLAARAAVDSWQVLLNSIHALVGRATAAGSRRVESPGRASSRPDTTCPSRAGDRRRPRDAWSVFGNRWVRTESQSGQAGG
jgi:outer membrane protein